MADGAAIGAASGTVGKVGATNIRVPDGPGGVPRVTHIPAVDAGNRARVLILGGGFAGLHAALGLAKLPVDVTLVDRRNHHTFQPLLYQVALAVLHTKPGSPIPQQNSISMVTRRNSAKRTCSRQCQKSIDRKVLRLTSRPRTWKPCPTGHFV